MFRRSDLQTKLLSLLVILAIITVAGCAAKKSLSGIPESGLILQYSMPDNQSLKYQTSSEFTQKMDIMDQSVEIESNEMSVFSVSPKGREGDNYRLGVTIDAMSMSISSPRGEITSDMSSVVGKSFDMSLSSLGKEGDLSGAKSIQYEMTPGNMRNIASGFQVVFPDLPGKPVKIGDTWVSNDTITDESSSGEIRMFFESLNKLEGFETIDGMECAKITAVITGTLDGVGEEQGIEMITEAGIEASDTWYFAYKEGIFVKMISSGTAEGKTTASGPQSMTIPFTREYSMETKLIR